MFSSVSAPKGSGHFLAKGKDTWFVLTANSFIILVCFHGVVFVNCVKLGLFNALVNGVELGPFNGFQINYTTTQSLNFSIELGACANICLVRFYRCAQKSRACAMLPNIGSFTGLRRLAKETL